MARLFVVLVVLSSASLSKSQHESVSEEANTSEQGNPSYSYSYGVADSNTGDIKTVWEAKDGDTVKGHYSVVEPDGSMRTVEYSAGPKTGFTAVVNTEASPVQPQVRQARMQPKAMRDFERYYDFSENGDFDYTNYQEKKKLKHPYDEAVPKRRPQYQDQLQEPSDYTHSITIKHPREEVDPETAESHSHFGIHDPHCKKHKKESHKPYPSLEDLDFRKHKFSGFGPEKDSYHDAPSFDYEKVINPYTGKYKFPSHDSFEGKPPSSKYGYPSMPDFISSHKFYPEDLPSRPKKKVKPHKKPELGITAEDLDDYVLVPKKKLKHPMKGIDLNEYSSGPDDEYEHPFPSGFEESVQDERYHSPPRPSKQKEEKDVVRKVVKKRKPVINLLDIFDI